MLMRFNSKGCIITTVALVIVGFIVSIVIVLAVWRGRAWRARLTAEAPASVTNVMTREVRRRRSNRDETVVTYRYVVGGITYTGERTHSGRHNEYSPGTPWKACYDPSNPSDSLLVAPDYQCGQ